MSDGICCICGSSCITNNYCSNECRQASTVIAELGKELIAQPINKDDRRVFFYDAGFGYLADLYTILILRRLFCGNIREQITVDNLLSKLDYSIKTKLNRNVWEVKQREAVAKMVVQLLIANAKLWRLREKAMCEQLGIEARQQAALQYLCAMSLRDKVKNALDLAVEGQIRLSRVY